MADSGFTTEEKRQLEAYFGEECLMEIWRAGEQRWKKNSGCFDEVVTFMKKLPSEIVVNGVGGFICKLVKEIADKQGRHPKKVMEEVSTIDNPAALRSIFHQFLSTISAKA